MLDGAKGIGWDACCLSLKTEKYMATSQGVFLADSCIVYSMVGFSRSSARENDSFLYCGCSECTGHPHLRGVMRGVFG